jgi:methyl-accepting chemotaxis protein
MNNLKFAYKMLIVIGVLVAAAAVITLVSVLQLNNLNGQIQRLVDVTVHSLHTASLMRLEMIECIRYEKNAIISTNDDESKRFVDESRKAAARTDRLRETLVTLVETHPEDRALVEEFTRNWEEFKKVQKEVLRLSILNTNAKVDALLAGRLNERTNEMVASLDTLIKQIDREIARPDIGDDLARLTTLYKKGRALLDLRSDVRELFILLTQHSLLTNDKDMDRLDGSIRELTGRLRTHLAEVRTSANDRERLELERVQKAVADIEETAKQIQSLSHEKSITKAFELTLGAGRQAAVPADHALSKLVENLTQRMLADKETSQHVYETSKWTTIGVAIVGLLLGLALALSISRSIRLSLGRCASLFEEVARGDLTGQMNLKQTDEIGQLAQAMDKVTGTLQGIVGEIRGVSQSISSSADQLTRDSQGLLAQSEEVTVQASSVASGTEQMATNIHTMAAAAEEMSVNMSSISSASEEISVNVGTIAQAADATAKNVEAVNQAIEAITRALQDIAGEAQEGAQTTEKAKSMAVQTTQTMNALDRASGEINKVTELIKMIALQTNLLALNATIEATSAGEAGKGFAVVAGEIKELAHQSARAAEEIARKIEGVQTSTRQAVQVIESGAKNIDTINSSAGRISEAVARQTKVSHDIVKNVNEASRRVANIAKSIAEVAKGATDMSRNTGEASGAATDVSRNASEAARAAELVSSNIHGVSQATKESTASATRVHEAAQELKKIATELARAVGQFRLEK